MNRLGAPALTAASHPNSAGVHAAFGAALIVLLGVCGYFIFPNDLALLTRMIVAAIFVLSLDMVIGFCGVATLGHAVLFGAGAYAAGYAGSHGITAPTAMLAIGLIAGAFAGLLSGALVARSRGLAQLVITIAGVQLAHAAANKFAGVTGGSDGMTGIVPTALLGRFPFGLWGETQYFLGVTLLAGVFFLLWILARSPFGQLCRAIRTDPLRVRSMGAAVYPALVVMYTFSGAVAGIAGALAAITTGVIGLDSVSFEWSADALVMLMLGGAGSLYGAITGALAYTAFQHVVAAINPFHWLIVVGGVLVFIVLVMPDGLQSLPRLLHKRYRATRKGNRAWRRST